MNTTKHLWIALLMALLALAIDSTASAELVLHFDMEQANSPLVDVAHGLTAEEVDDGHLYSLPGPEGFGLAAGLEENGSWQLDEDESQIFREFANDFSVAAWIYLDSDTLANKAALGEPNYALNRFFGDDIAWDADGWGMGIWEDGRVRFTKNGVVDLDTADSWVELDEWTHVAATISSSDGVTIFVNGEVAQLFEDTRDLNNGQGNNGLDDIYGVGRTYGYGEGQWVGGRFDEIRVYDNVLSEEEIAQLLVPGGGGIAGDFNGDGVLDNKDIDDLTLQSASMSHPAAYDLNKDALVDSQDIVIWVKDLFGSWIGDADLNDEFNSGDLVTVLSAGTYESDVDSVWSSGDFSGDGRTDSSDLVAALSDGGYELGPRAAVAAVPEPTSVLLTVLGMLGLALHRRHNRV